MAMQTLLSGGKSIRWSGSVPKTPGPHQAILLLHGSGGNVELWLERISPILATVGVAVFAVHYFDRTDTMRADPAMLADGVHVPLWLSTIRDMIAHLASHPGVDPARIALVGISLGAFLALALGSEPGDGIRAIVDISGGLVSPYAEHASRQFPPTLILHGDADMVVSLSHARALNELLNVLGVEHELRIFTGEGHWFTAAAQLQILDTMAIFLRRVL